MRTVMGKGKAMKKFLLSIICVTLAFGALCAVGCGEGSKGGDSSSVTTEVPEETTYVVTFKQSGQLDIEKTVKEGETLTDIPTPAAKIGYTVAWEEKDLTNITEDRVVNAVETANTYTVKYDLNGGAGELDDTQVTFDSAYDLTTPTREGYSFVGWTNGEEAVLTSGEKWTIAENVTLKANWAEVKVEVYTVVFIQDGEALKTFENIPSGSAFTAVYQIPEPIAKVGYNVAWDNEALAKLESVTQDVTVVAKATAKTYTVNLDADGGNVALANITVTYGVDYEIPTPTKDGYEFLGWKKDGMAFAVKGTWKLDENVTLKASWKKIETEEDGSSEYDPEGGDWTGVHRP